MIMVGEVGVADACGRKGSGNVDSLQLKLTVTMSSLKPGGLGCLNAGRTGQSNVDSRVTGV